MKNGWREIDFDRAIADESGGNVKTPQGEFQDSGLYPIVDQGKELIAGYTDDPSRLCKADLPVIVFGDHTRALKYVDFPFCMGADGTKVLRPKCQADEKYLFYYLSSLNLPNEGYSRHFKFLKRFKVLLPPLDEQRRIAAILDQAEALRAKRRQAIAHLDTLTQSIFIEMFRPDRDDIERIPLRHLTREFRYGTSTKSESNGYPALRIPNVIGGGIDLTDLKNVPVDDAEFKRLQLADGDVLFVRTNGNQENVGRCAVYNTDSVEAKGFDPSCFIYASYLIRARLDRARLSPVVLREFLGTSEGKRALHSRSKTSAGQFNINTEGLGDIPVILPKVSLQERFVLQVEIIERAKAQHTASLVQLDALFASLQHRAFRGEL